MNAKTQRITLSYILLVVLLCVMLASYMPTVGIAYAQDKVYSNVLDDLKKDSVFSEKYYPEKENDYSLQVINVAESVDNELFVYVYQPSGQKKNLRASSINISTKPKWDVKPHNYFLEYLNSSGTLFKYKVKDFTVITDVTRYYCITSIYRPFDKELNDTEPGAGQAITEVDYAVKKQYEFGTINEEPYIHVVDVDTITVTDKFVGFVRYKSGFKLCPEACDSHFIAFNTDYPIDKLLEADVSYTTQEYDQITAPGAGTTVTFGKKSGNVEATLRYTDNEVVYDGGGWFSATYKWDTIQTVEQFIAQNSQYENVYSGVLLDLKVGTKITEEGKKSLEGLQWVLRFANTPYVSVPSIAEVRYTLVGDVTILRLKFETAGHLYNLGVIDNKQTGSSEPIGGTDISDIKAEPTKFSKWLAIAICIALLLVLIILLAPILPYIFKAIFWLISLPFRAIGAIVKACKKSKDKDKAVDVPLEDKVIENVKSGKTKAKRTKRVRKNE